MSSFEYSGQKLCNPLKIINDPSDGENWCKVIVFWRTMKLGYNELGFYEHSVITNIFLGQMGQFTTQINAIITNPGYNEPRL